MVEVDTHTVDLGTFVLQPEGVQTRPSHHLCVLSLATYAEYTSLCFTNKVRTF